MEYKRLGHSGLQVSRIILGCMGFGDPSRGTHEWAIGIDEARPIIRQALEAGITTFDTANVYSLGASEEIVGQVLGELTKRDDVIIATKVFSRMGPGPKDAGLSRAAIFAQVEQSLQRLKTDYIDLYQIHRYDPNTPIEETMEALHDLVKSGKVRYIGASSMYAWQFAQAQYVADLHGWTRFVSMQDQYNLLMREEEREMLPFCLDQGVGVIPWSPLARGLLTREWSAHTRRSETDRFTKSLYSQAEEANHQIVATVQTIAEAHHVPMARIALAWLLQKEAVTGPIVGVTRLQHLTDAVAAVDLKLSDEEMRRLEASYIPQFPVGF
ncbi:MAG: aldo/keto reductase [Chloroflexi bacterium]|nr:MAG: aldo/keto reductase [Chloroflexota bacterium]